MKTQKLTPVPEFKTLGQMALLVGVQEYHLRQLTSLGLIPFALAGRNRIFSLSDTDAIRSACLTAGYLKSQKAVARGN